jgi:thiol:disulfide interchange protein
MAMPLLRPLHILVALISVLRLAILPAEAAPQQAATEQVRAELLAAVDAVHPGEEILLGIRQRIIPHWHTYWINPGDSGIATRIAWKLPPGAQAGDIQWPVPSRFQSGPIVNFAYENEVTLLVPVRVPSTATVGSLFPVVASVDWLVCREDCIPQQAELELVLPITAPGTPRREYHPLIDAARVQLPVTSPWPIRAEAQASGLSLQLTGNAFAAETIRDVRFYPAEWGRIAHAAAQTWQVDPRGIVLSLTPGEAPANPGEPLRGVLVVSETGSEGPIRRGFVVDAELIGATATDSDVGLATALLLALLGGVVLNLMPCVFPVLSIKALSLLQHAQQTPREARRQGIAYTLGVLASFVLLASVLIVLKAGGSRIGWGFQFQSPLFVLAVVYLVFVVGLSLSGVFTVGVSVTGIGSALAERPGYAGSFFTGVLATVVATPCTAPFMAAAVGFALTQPAAALLGIFLSLGCGLALPYLLLSHWPALQRRLPRPGPWMERTRQFLAFPMYGTTVWLLWVLAQQTGTSAIGIALGGMVVLAFAAWLYDSTRHGSASVRRGGAGVAALAAALAVLGGLSGIDAGAPAATTLRDRNWEAYGAARLAELRRSGQPVFLNFTAAWCISCLINERVALSDAAVADAFRDAGITYLKGDWTNRDQAITTKLAEFGRSGVPLYVYFPPGGSAAPVVLPQILTPQIVLDAVRAPALIATHHP